MGGEYGADGYAVGLFVDVAAVCGDVFFSGLFENKFVDHNITKQGTFINISIVTTLLWLKITEKFIYTISFNIKIHCRW